MLVLPKQNCGRRHKREYGFMGDIKNSFTMSLQQYHLILAYMKLSNTI